MSRIFVTGSSEGLGLMAGRLLSEQGHDVVLHARNTARAQDAGTRFAEPRLSSAMSRPLRAPEASQNRRMRLAALTPLFITSPSGTKSHAVSRPATDCRRCLPLMFWRPTY